MDAYVAFLPIAEKITAAQARRVADALLTDTCESELARSALALALLQTSWTHGRLKLAKHLQLLDRSLGERNGGESYHDLAVYVLAAADLEEARKASLAQQYAQVWSADIDASAEGPEYHWILAQRGFKEALHIEPDDARSKRLLDRLLGALRYCEGDNGRAPFRAQSGRRRRIDGLVEEVLSTSQAHPVGVANRCSQTQANRAQGHRSRVNVLDMRRAPDQMGLVAALLAEALPPMEFNGQRAVAGPPTNERKPYLRSARETSVEAPAPHSVAVYDRKEVLQALERAHQGGPYDDNRRQLSLLQNMADGTALRPVAQQPAGEVLALLYPRFPHFVEVLDFVSRALALAACGQDGRPVRIPPLLLRGEPGTGKTYFAQELARVLALPFIERDLSVISEAFVINGMDSAWKNSKPGVVFDSVVHGNAANPLILLNEVDKAAVTGTNNSPLAPMHALLEPTSSSRFVDEFVPVPIDASRVVWVLTANDGHVPEPVLSRLEVFDIARPTSEQCKAIASSVWAGIQERALPAGHGFDGLLADDVVARIAEVSPRVMRKVLTDAAGFAAREQRKAITCRDLEVASARYLQSVKGGIGFMTSR